jgi:hypothetical protein
MEPKLGSGEVVQLTFRTSPVDYLRISAGAKSDGGLILYGGARGRAG